MFIFDRLSTHFQKKKKIKKGLEFELSPPNHTKISPQNTVLRIQSMNVY